MSNNTAAAPFSGYQKIVIFILSITQFTVILDFMVISPLGDLLMKSMSLKPSQFGAAVSAYAISAGISGLMTAGFADRFDRKKLLLFFYTGFIAGTFCCGLANTYVLLITARIVTGLFGGVIGSISMAIITDLFDIHHRGRVMGFVQMGLGASQVMGIPVGLYISNLWGWQAPFLMIGLMALLIAVLIAVKLQPITSHLSAQHDKSPLLHLLHTVAKKEYRVGFTATTLLSIGGFMMMPFSSAFAINNLGITSSQLPFLFMVSGVASFVLLPLVGKLSDRIDKFTLFTIATVWMMIIVLYYTNLSTTPLWMVMIINVVMSIGIFSRMIPSAALSTGIPELADRGAYMSIGSSLQQIAGGAAAAVAGMIVVQKDKFSPLEHYNRLGLVMVGISLVAIYPVYRMSNLIKRRMHEKTL